MSADVEKLQRTLALYKGLVEVSTLISGITEFDALLPAILDVAKRVFDAEASSLILVNDNGDLELVIARTPGGELESAHVVVPRGSGIAGWVVENRSSLLVPDAYADPRFYPGVDKLTGFRTRSILCVPLIRNDAVTGAIQVINPAGRDAWTGDDIAPLEAYAALVAAAIEKVRALEQQRKTERIDRELALAHEIQESFLPKRRAVPSGLRLATLYRPARNIGGDFFDFIETPEGCLFVIGDVSGKGIPAALLMARAVSAFRFSARADQRCSELLAHWNTAMSECTIRGMFVTALLGRVTFGTRRVELACAGHLPPLLIFEKAGAGDVAMHPGPPLGILRHATYPQAALDLPPGAQLVLYTDGLTESFDADDRELGRDGAAALLKSGCGSPEEIVAALERGEAAHRGEREPHDDLTILALSLV
jgi:sigma-B regulation protein RsbU (phosphoserine phosphatase)